MFNFFKKKEKIKPEDTVVASIKYLINKDGSGPLIDVELGEDDDECVEALCSLLNVLGSDMFYIDTINMIRSLLLKSNQEELLFKVMTRINHDIREKIIKSNNGKVADEPCIRPSDMLK